MTSSTARRAARVSPLVAVGLTLVAAPSWAHVSVTPSDSGAGAHATASFAFSHGCDGSPTTKVAIAVPEAITSVTPTRHALFDVETVVEKLDEPVAGAHGTVTQRVSQVVFTARIPLPDGVRDAVEISFQVPDAEGEVLAFPTVQTCEKGENAWIEETPVGGEEPEHPAPAFTVTAASGDGHGHGAQAGGEAVAETGAGAEPVAAGSDEGRDPLTWVSLVLGAAGLLVGGAALGRRRNA